MTNLCDVCGKPATQSMLRDLFGKSDAMRFVCSDHGFRMRDPADVAEIERLQKREDQLIEFLRSFISGGVNQDFKPWARELYQKLYSSDEPCEQRCPHDGGKCHHGCADECFRATGGGSLSNPWPGFPVACTHPIKGAMPDIGEAIAMKADEGRQCTCAKDNHGVDCAWNGCCGQCSGMRT